MPTDEQIEKDIQAAGKTGPRITPDHIEAQIANELYQVLPGTTVTLCVLTMRNGFTIVGHSAAADPANFDEEIGRKVSRQRAVDQIWPLEGYLLKSILAGQVRRLD